MATDITMNDMDIDFDMDAEIDPEIARLQAEAEAINARAEAADTEVMNGVEEAEEGEVDASAPALNKVHVRGLDKLSQDDIMQWAEEHAAMELFKKVQWIDDTSANLIYDTELAAAEALNAFSAEESLDPLQLRQARRLSTHPEVELQVRQAITADVKAPGAKDRSKFYLFRKEWDPDNPDNIRPDNRKRRWMDDSGVGDRKYRRRDYGDERPRRREPRGERAFHEDMYGDDPQAGDDSRRNSHSSGSDHVRRQVRYNEDLIGSKDRGRLRNRSASPIRDGDGRFGFRDDQPRRPTARARSRSQGIRAGKDNKSRRDQLRRELFPEKRTSTTLTDDPMDDSSRDNRPDRLQSSSLPRELFPDRSNGSVHRRQSAKHISANEVADAIGRRPGNGGERWSVVETAAGRDLFSRISGGPGSGASFGRLNDRTTATETGFSFKGAGRNSATTDRPDNGFSILGASRERTQNPLVKELFPLKTTNSESGKDLFDGRIKGRGAQRRRAEDLF